MKLRRNRVDLYRRRRRLMRRAGAVFDVTVVCVAPHVTINAGAISQDRLKQLEQEFYAGYRGFAPPQQFKLHGRAAASDFAMAWARQVRRITSAHGGDLRPRICLTPKNALALLNACEVQGLQRSKREIVLDGFGPRGPRLNVFPSGRTAIQTVPIRMIVRRVVHLPAGDLGSSAKGSCPEAVSGSTPEPAGPLRFVRGFAYVTGLQV